LKQRASPYLMLNLLLPFFFPYVHTMFGSFLHLPPTPSAPSLSPHLLAT
jgi:hypothetical protein